MRARWRLSRTRSRTVSEVVGGLGFQSAWSQCSVAEHEGWVMEYCTSIRDRPCCSPRHKSLQGVPADWRRRCHTAKGLEVAERSEETDIAEMFAGQPGRQECIMTWGNMT